ncbi:MAG: hypothetical protein RML32_08495 [Gammaproteobacteria bacterium]|nr:hypothetical protein [Gammaproteobacteria bacterium]
MQDMQNLLGAIYDVPIAHRVDDFLLTDRTQLPPGALQADEQLLVSAGDDALRVGLFVDPAVLARLRNSDPADLLHSGNLGDFLTAIEGVSHFHYLTFHARYDRAVSPLELELQAEIDKYVACLWLMRRQCPDRFPAELRAQLFSDSFRIDPRLGRTERALYEQATVQAERYCRAFERRVRQAHPRPLEECAAGLRRFYRWSFNRKLAHIRELH